MSGYASIKEVREVIKDTLTLEGRDPKNYNVTAIARDGFPARSGGGYGWPVPDEWCALVKRHQKKKP